jgi:hypothetical protein
VSEDERFFAWMAIQLSKRPEFANSTKEQLADTTCEWLNYFSSRAYEYKTGVQKPTILNIVGRPFLSLVEGAKRMTGKRTAKQAMLELERIVPPEHMQIFRSLNRINRDYCEWWRELIQETRQAEEREKKSLAGRKTQAKLRAKKSRK